MKFIYRLGYYLAGFSVGLILLTFIFSGKKTSCNYSPSARVKNDILQKNLVLPPDFKFSDSVVIGFIRKGKIDFSKSQTKLDSCRQYRIDLENAPIRALVVENCSKTIKILELQ
ncbi:hypothetical protein N8873_05045 [Flavobacteriaceae bacterium]|jgi:hypothetical protein|nr:hypothetical protein [Flavobacteriaceae bacterium]MDA7711412.1 hypothetical protein [Flavobacteriaceae bacterium]